MLINYIFDIFVLVFGVCIGSFLNCVIYRFELQADMPEGSPQRKAVSFLRGKSFCPNCKHTLFWKDLFPVFSFLFLGGRCKYCGKSISWQYPIVEIFTGLLFLFIFTNSPQDTIYNILNIALLFYITASLIIIFIYDLKHYLIPDKILFPAIIITIVFRVLEFFNVIKGSLPISNYLWAVLISAGFFFALFMISGGKWMGFGDVKLAILMGLLLGVNNVIVALFLAFFFGSIIGVLLIIFGKKGLKSEIPFGPFLIMGTFLAIFFGNQIIQWYSSLFLM